MVLVGPFQLRMSCDSVAMTTAGNKLILWQRSTNGWVTNYRTRGLIIYPKMLVMICKEIASHLTAWWRWRQVGRWAPSYLKLKPRQNWSLLGFDYQHKSQVEFIKALGWDLSTEWNECSDFQQIQAMFRLKLSSLGADLQLRKGRWWTQVVLAGNHSKLRSGKVLLSIIWLYEE